MCFVSWSVVSWLLADALDFELPSLPYTYDALEPYIDARTMEIHYTKHHNTYVTKLNKALKGKAEKADAEELTSMQKKALHHGALVRNNVGGHYNHALFWINMAPPKNSTPSGNLKSAINVHFGGFRAMKDGFKLVASNQFGSGWVWLGVTPDRRLSLTSTAEQDNPLMDGLDYKHIDMIPILGLDVWEHAYYLKYQNRRSDYVDAFWNVVNWEQVARNYAMAMKGKPVTPVEVEAVA